MVPATIRRMPNFAAFARELGLAYAEARRDAGSLPANGAVGVWDFNSRSLQRVLHG